VLIPQLRPLVRIVVSRSRSATCLRRSPKGIAGRKRCRSEDALESALAMYIAAKEPLPAPSKAEAGEEMMPLPALGMTKTGLYDAMREQGVGRAELARRLRWHLPQVNRVLDLRHASRMEHVEAALAALGLWLIVDVARAA
jgi:antitoxin HicB